MFITEAVLQLLDNFLTIKKTNEIWRDRTAIRQRAGKLDFEICACGGC